MKKIAILILLLFCINVSSFAQDVVSCETDEFTGQTTCQSDSIVLSSSQSNVSRTILQYIYQSESKTFYTILAFGSSEWQYLNTEKIYFLLDGERENYELLSIDTDVSSGTVIEQYGIQMVLEDVERFINAEEIRFKIRNDIYEFNDQAKDRMNLLKEKISELESQE